MNLKQAMSVMERRRLYLLNRAVKNSYDLAEISAIDKILVFINERIRKEVIHEFINQS